MEPVARADWFKFRSVDFTQLDALEDCLDAFTARTLDGVVIRRVYPEEYMREISARIERHEPPFHVFPRVADPLRARQGKHLYGITLVAAPRDLSEYFRVAEGFRSHCRELFLDGADYEARLKSIFEVLGGGRPVELPRNPDGQGYMPATIRILPAGAAIDLHCDNNLSHHPSYTHLKTVCDVNDQLSFFLTLNAPGSGGELVVYSRRWSDSDDVETQYVVSKDASMVEGCESLALKPGPGDLILFAGGRIYHRVAPTEGNRPRYTIGGFLARANEGRALYYWS
ncbi:2OG-Fe(II) oxygenase [Myxococcus sp. K15C18031901]|uniref:2OG-Fe(II) oxygenase n=1 Tax=Myxococcus dinghuensis TaxID=2906761 RepID=UPI0020A7F53A|nr:2OG-Fe(II) oxygenase [Myxococcus dinghuensis]MCP3101653.1 2OG-Fe(II) oxygenase [Myxococcus dinghuensis]